MAERSGHQWFQFLKTNQIDIGKVTRIFAKKMELKYLNASYPSQKN